MEQLKLTLTLTIDGDDTAVGFLYDKDVTKDDFIKYAQVLIKCIVRKLETKEVFT